MDSTAIGIGIDSRSSVDDYRTRIYDQYVHARPNSLAPITLKGLAPRAAYLRRLIGSTFPDNRDARILDLGCGHGALTYFAHQLGYRNIVAIDRSPQQVAAANALGIEGVRQGDLFETLIATPSQSVDVVVCFDVIEHFRRDELLPFVDEVLRVLRTGGRWIIHVPNAEGPFGSRILFGDLTHEMAFTRTSLAQLLLASGFARVKCLEDEPAVHGAASAVRWVLWKMVRALLLCYTAIETGRATSGQILSENLLAVATK